MKKMSLLEQCIVLLLLIHWAKAQTEGDAGYDYDAAYNGDDYDEDPVLGLEPEFDVKILNVTVVAGQTAVLPCSIDYLGKYKVAWLDHNSIPLTYDDRRIVDDPRFSIVRPFIKEWNLQIQAIKWEDQGTYRCTINTNPIKDKVVQLHVKVPAQIIDELSSNDETVQEGDTIALVCNVTGVPRPEVTWYRRPANSKVAERERIGLTGEMIIIQNVTRYCDDIYECVAKNGVPPAVSRQIRVTVEFAPEITMHNRRIMQQLGKETILECSITAFPHAINYWEKDGKRIGSSNRHRIDAYDEGANQIVLSLRVMDIREEDYGEYKCVAANALGRDEEAMYIYRMPKPENHVPTPPTQPIIVPMTKAPIKYPKPTPKKAYKDYGNSYNTIGKDDYENEDGVMPASGRVTGNKAGSVLRDYGYLTSSITLLLTYLYTHSC